VETAEGKVGGRRGKEGGLVRSTKQEKMLSRFGGRKKKVKKKKVRAQGKEKKRRPGNFSRNTEKGERGRRKLERDERRKG